MEGNQEYIKNKCPNCGADLKFLAGSKKIKCDNCDSEFDIESLGHGKLDEEETDFVETLEKLEKENTNKQEVRTIHCQDCGGLIELNQRTVSTICPFCGSSRVVEESKQDSIIKINGVIPFTLKEDEVYGYFKKWLKKKALVPSKLRKGTYRPTFSAFYIPFYTFDSSTHSHYSAYRGDYYYVTVYRNGKAYKEKRTKWTRVSGSTNRDFDDLVIRGTKNALDKHIDRIKEFDFNQMEKYKEEFLLGYYAERPSVSLKDGFVNAKQEMLVKIKSDCIRQIGGDTYKDLSVSTKYEDVTFKQIMAPIYNGHYTYNNKNYVFVCNAQTGKFDGKAPKSAFKVFLIVLLFILIAFALFLLAYYDAQSEESVVLWKNLMNLI